MKRPTVAVYLLTLGSLVVSVSARADSVGINFVGGQPFFPIPAGPVTGIAGAPGLGQSNWNNETGTSGSASGLLNTSGASTGVGVSWTTIDTWQSLTGSSGPATQNAQLMNGYLDSTSQVMVSGIPYGTYEVIVYFNGDSPAEDRVNQFTIGSTSIFGQDNSLFNGTFIQVPGSSNSDKGTNTPAGNYTIFQGLSGSSFTLDASPGSSLGAERSTINAIQIAAIPEPPTFVLFGVAMLATFIVFKKKILTV